MTSVCPACGKGFKGLRLHLLRSGKCARGFSSEDVVHAARTIVCDEAAIPLEITLGVVAAVGQSSRFSCMEDVDEVVVDASHTCPGPNSLSADPPNPDISSRLRPRENTIDYASSSKKRVCAIQPDNGFPMPDVDLGNYMTTFFNF